MNVNTYIASLVQYGHDRGLIEDCDRTYITNQLLQALCLDSCEPAAPAEMPLEEIRCSAGCWNTRVSTSVRMTEEMRSCGLLTR